MFNLQVSLSALISNRLLLYISLYRAYNDHMAPWIVHKDLASGSHNWEYYSPNVIRLNEVSYKNIQISSYLSIIWENYITIAGFEHFPVIYHSFFVVVVTEKLFSKCGRTCIISSNLLEMQMLRPHLRPVELETLGMGPSNLGFHKSSRDYPRSTG